MPSLDDARGGGNNMLSEEQKAVDLGYIIKVIVALGTMLESTTERVRLSATVSQFLS